MHSAGKLVAGCISVKVLVVTFTEAPVIDGSEVAPFQPLAAALSVELSVNEARLYWSFPDMLR